MCVSAFAPRLSPRRRTRRWPPTGARQLVGFVVSERDPADAEAAVMAAARAALPAYMVPAAVHVLRRGAPSCW